MSLPPEVEKHILLLSENQWLNDLTPVQSGSTENVFFCANAKIHLRPSVEVRTVTVPIPSELKVVYERYPPNVEFTTPNGWVYLSEEEIAHRNLQMKDVGQTRIVDFAYTYAGMGHITVLSYDPVTRHVFTSMDGGSNGYDREYNHKARIALDMDAVEGKLPYRLWYQQEITVVS